MFRQIDVVGAIGILVIGTVDELLAQASRRSETIAGNLAEKLTSTDSALETEYVVKTERPSTFVTCAFSCGPVRINRVKELTPEDSPNAVLEVCRLLPFPHSSLGHSNACPRLQRF